MDDALTIRCKIFLGDGNQVPSANPNVGFRIGGIKGNNEMHVVRPSLAIEQLCEIGVYREVEIVALEPEKLLATRLSSIGRDYIEHDIEQRNEVIAAYGFSLEARVAMQDILVKKDEGVLLAPLPSRGPVGEGRVWLGVLLAIEKGKVCVNEKTQKYMGFAPNFSFMI